MNWLYDIFAQLFDIGGLLGFILGVMAARLWSWAADLRADRKDPANRPHHTGFRSLTTLYVLAFLVMAFVAVQQYAQTKCNREFQQAIVARDKASSKDKDLNKQDTQARVNWIKS